MVFWEGYVSDEVMGIFAPIVVYWLYAGFYQSLPATTLDKYRLHTRKEGDAKNIVPMRSAIKAVLVQQLVHATVSYLLFLVQSKTDLVGTHEIQPPLLVQIFQVIIAMFVLDIWQYFMHRYMHTNKFLYRHIHAQHHKLVAPYAIAAFYNHPMEGVFDTIGASIAFLVSGMTARTAIPFFCLIVVKTVDDHCGLWLPGNVFHMLFPNNTAFHDIHHQLHGSMYNFSQPFFPIWDKLLGTHMPYDLVKRPEGGFEVRVISKD
ncbi:putative sphingolipid C4-monooxygenase [Helianthus annuus]|nr:putative sphingolipid C4-monooxygenase [Helianthus annuus]